MTIETKRAIDAKIAQLGDSRCIDFMLWIYPDCNGIALEKAARQPGAIQRRVRALLRGENWDDLTQLFLNYGA